MESASPPVHARFAARRVLSLGPSRRAGNWPSASRSLRKNSSARSAKSRILGGGPTNRGRGVRPPGSITRPFPLAADEGVEIRRERVFPHVSVEHDGGRRHRREPSHDGSVGGASGSSGATRCRPCSSSSSRERPRLCGAPRCTHDPPVWFPFFDTMVSPPGTARRFEPRPMSCPGSRFAAERVRR